MLKLNKIYVVVNTKSSNLLDKNIVLISSVFWKKLKLTKYINKSLYPKLRDSTTGI